MTNSLIYSVQSVTKFVNVHENFLLSENDVDSRVNIQYTQDKPQVTKML